MKTKAFWIIFVLVALWLIFVNIVLVTPTASEEIQPTYEQQQTHVINDVNTYRASKGLKPVAMDHFTCAYATKRLKQMSPGDWSHEGLKQDLLHMEDYYPSESEWGWYGENLAMDVPYDKVVAAWRTSPTHDEILTGDYEYMCIQASLVENSYFLVLEAWNGE